MSQNETWADGKQLSGPVEIASGVTVTIAPGAKITAATSATITIKGTLQAASAAGAHAKIAAATATGTWGGLVVASSGTLALDGVDLDNAASAIHVQAGNADAKYDRGTITAAQTPFEIDAGGKLATTRAAVLGAKGASSINGDFTTSYLDYQKVASAEGLIAGDPGATMFLADSIFRATASGGGDYIVSNAAKLIHVEYSTITGSHCGFHFNAVAKFEIDHVTDGADAPTGKVNLNSWGAMLYGSGAGPHTISNSNFMNSGANLDLAGKNGRLTITNTYTTGKNTASGAGWIWIATDVAKTPILDAKPR